MTVDERADLDARLDQMDQKLDRLADLVARLAEDLDHAAAQRESVDAGVADIRTDLQRGFSDLRHTIRHLVARVGEVSRWR